MQQLPLNTIQDFEEIKKLFLLDVSNVVKMDEICEEMIVNWDQTGMSQFPPGLWKKKDPSRLS